MSDALPRCNARSPSSWCAREMQPSLPSQAWMLADFRQGQCCAIRNFLYRWPQRCGAHATGVLRALHLRGVKTANCY
eukprot:1154747-Pelagomonas_calceolata.AAC.2